jgi:uncharacterized protein (DUF2249 family)
MDRLHANPSIERGSEAGVAVRTKEEQITQSLIAQQKHISRQSSAIYLDTHNHMKVIVCSIFLMLSFVTKVNAQQVADTLFSPVFLNPAYSTAEGPVVMIDQAHNNFHTADGRYRTFADLLTRDGYVVRAFSALFNRESLDTGDILVISNALHKRNLDDWSLPTPSAFTEQEITAVRAWVEDGGALLLIADHMPFPGAAADLAAAFGFRFNNGFALDTLKQGPLVFRRSDGSLANHPITQGRTSNERIDSVATFTGQAFQSSAAEPLLIFGPNTISLMPQVAWQFSDATSRIPVRNWFQGAVLQVGKGRVAVFGEAAMFTAQVSGENRTPMGMNHPSAPQNPQFALNVLHWLSGLLRPEE